MRLLLLVFTLALALAVKSVPAVPHVPMQVVAPTAEFEVPWWLGGYVATTNASSEWMLPLTYPNGGRTNAGTTLVIQNRGPYNITLYAQTPETIQGLGTYLVIADSTVQFLSATDWVVVSSTFGAEGLDGNFDYLQAENVSVQNWMGVGTADPPNKERGDLTASRLFVGNDTFIPSPGYRFMVRDTATQTSGVVVLADFIMFANPSTTSSSSFRPLAINLYIPSGTPDLTGVSVGIRGAITHGGASVTSLVTAQLTNSLSSTFVSPSQLTHSTTLDITPASASGTPTGTVVNNYGIRIQTPSLGSGPMVMTTLIGMDIVALTPAANTAIGLRISAPTTATNKIALQLSDTGATSAGGIAWGNFEFFEYRCAINTKCNTGSQRTAGYGSFGSIAAPANTAAGAISTTKVTPTLQAFGAVTANAASGVLAFTVSTAAASCSSAIVTNSNVVAGSEVILTIQKYTGAQFTNGRPSVSREDTAGSSSGNFNLQICNDHATNALNGNLYIAFWVLN